MRMSMCNKNGNVFIFCHVVILKNDNKREGIISIQLKGRPRGRVAAWPRGLLV